MMPNALRFRCVPFSSKKGAFQGDLVKIPKDLILQQGMGYLPVPNS